MFFLSFIRSNLSPFNGSCKPFHADPTEAHCHQCEAPAVVDGCGVGLLHLYDGVFFSHQLLLRFLHSQVQGASMWCFAKTINNTLRESDWCSALQTPWKDLCANMPYMVFRPAVHAFRQLLDLSDTFARIYCPCCEVLGYDIITMDGVNNGINARYQPLLTHHLREEMQALPKRHPLKAVANRDFFLFKKVIG